MKHFSRLSTRKSETPKEWLTTCSHIGEVVNAWAERNDVIVYGGEDAGMGQAVACFLHDTAEMEINIPQAFGQATTPAMVGDLRERENQYEFPAVVGVVFHEALHAKYSTWIEGNLLSAIPNSKVKDAFWLLEETRIEGLGAFTMPENALFLRSSSTTLSFAGVEDYLDTMSKTEAFVTSLMWQTLSERLRQRLGQTRWTSCVLSGASSKHSTRNYLLTFSEVWTWRLSGSRL